MTFLHFAIDIVRWEYFGGRRSKATSLVALLESVLWHDVVVYRIRSYSCVFEAARAIAAHGYVVTAIMVSKYEESEVVMFDSSRRLT